MACATVFVGAACHWLLDILYKYIIGAETKIVDYQEFFIISAIIVAYFVVRKRRI